MSKVSNFFWGVAGVGFWNVVLSKIVFKKKK